MSLIQPSAAYVEWLAEAALSASTIRNHVAGIKMFYQWWNKMDVVDCLSSQSWSSTSRGIVNTIRPSFDKRAALTLDDLTAIIQACSRHDDLTPIRVAATFGFCAFLRISNLAPPTAQEFDRARHTTFSVHHKFRDSSST